MHVCGGKRFSGFVRCPVFSPLIEITMTSHTIVFPNFLGVERVFSHIAHDLVLPGTCFSNLLLDRVYSRN